MTRDTGHRSSLTLADSLAAVQTLSMMRQTAHQRVAAEASGFVYMSWRTWVKRGKDAMTERAERGAIAVTATPAAPVGRREADKLACLFKVFKCICYPHAEFDLWCEGLALAVLEVNASAEVSLVLRARSGANDNPELALRMLERRYPARWSKAKDAGVSVTAGAGSALTIFAPAEVDPEVDGDGET